MYGLRISNSSSNGLGWSISTVLLVCGGGSVLTVVVVVDVDGEIEVEVTAVRDGVSTVSAMVTEAINVSDVSVPSTRLVRFAVEDLERLYGSRRLFTPSRYATEQA